MTIEKTRVLALLDQIETCWADSEERLTIARRFCEDDLLSRAILGTMAGHRRVFHQQIQEQIQEHGNSPPSGVSIGRRIRKVLTAAGGAICEDTLSVHLEECLEGCHRTEKVLREALDRDLPDSLADLLGYQLQVLREDREKLDHLLEGNRERAPASPDGTSRTLRN